MATRVLLDGTAGRDDLLLGRAGDLVDRNSQLNRNITVAENLDLLVLAHSTLGHEVADGHIAALRVELGETLEVDNLVLDPERVLESAQLGRAHHLIQVAALEADAHLVASLAPLGASACGLALRTLTASDAGLGLLGSGGRAKVVRLEDLRTCVGRSRLLGSGLRSSGLGRGCLVSGS